MDDIETGPDRIDPARTLFLGLTTMALAVLFTVLLIGDTVSATTF